MEFADIAPMMAHLSAPMAAVSSRWGGKVNAQIAVLIGSGSVVPTMPRVLVQISKANLTHEMILKSGAFALNFLRKDQLQYVRDFGLVSGRDVDKLANVPYETKASGSPIIKDCWGYLDCRVVNAMDSGFATCVMGDVLEGGMLSEGEPLWASYARTAVPAEWLQEWDNITNAAIERSMKTMNHIDYTPWKP